MDIPVKALELENRSLGKHGEPTLAEAYEVLLECWRSGDRGRELGLHLMFLAWYMLCEPSHLTGHDEARTPSAKLMAVFNEIHDYFAPAIAHDAEMLYRELALAKEAFQHALDKIPDSVPGVPLRQRLSRIVAAMATSYR